MILANIFCDEDKRVRCFTVKGHANYAGHGQDIVCAAVSVLTINVINSIEALTKDPFTSQVEEESGDVYFSFTDTISTESDILMQSFVLGLSGIEESYGSEYIHTEIKAYR